MKKKLLEVTKSLVVGVLVALLIDHGVANWGWSLPGGTRVKEEGTVVQVSTSPSRTYRDWLGRERIIPGSVTTHVMVAPEGEAYAPSRYLFTYPADKSPIDRRASFPNATVSYFQGPWIYRSATRVEYHPKTYD